MNYVVDTHTHTLASGHAYNTLLENLKWASENGIKVLATTDHGPTMPAAAHDWFFSNYKVLPREIFGVTLLRGCEANVMDLQGNLDISDRLQKMLDIIIVSLHEPCIEPGSREKNTKAIINAMKNPYVDIIGHCGNPAYPIYAEEVVKAAKEHNVLIEINNSSLLKKGGSRKGSSENCKGIAALCREHNVKIVIGSDAHCCFQIGDFKEAHNLLMEVGMPEELIMNTDERKLISYLQNKGKLQDLSLD